MPVVVVVVVVVIGKLRSPGWHQADSNSCWYWNLCLFHSWHHQVIGATAGWAVCPAIFFLLQGSVRQKLIPKLPIWCPARNKRPACRVCLSLPAYSAGEQSRLGFRGTRHQKELSGAVLSPGEPEALCHPLSPGYWLWPDSAWSPADTAWPCCRARRPL